MPSRRRILATIALIALALLVAYQFSHNPEWRKFSWRAVWDATRAANPLLILGALVFIYSTYIVRALRWQVLMDRRAQIWPLIKGAVIGFTGVAFLGRPGELIRPYYYSRKCRSNISSQMAVWLLERAFDMSAVVLLAGLDLTLNPRVHALTSSSYDAAFRKAGLLVCGFVVVIVGSLIYVHHRSRQIAARIQRRLERRPGAVWHKLGNFLARLSEGTVGLIRPANLLLTIAYTLTIWCAVAATLWLVVLSYPAMLPGFSFSEALLLMGLTAVGSVVQLPAVGGGFQVLTLVGLTKIFSADTASATSAALLMWILCFYAIAPFGALLAAREGISWRRVEHEAIEAETADVPS